MVKKLLTIGIIFLFIGVAVAPSINSSVVKTSDDNGLVEVTSQACGIQGFGNTTVKLTKQQYQDLEQYLVDFRARLNQTMTREEAIPIFKDAVVELNKYGLLPKGMSVEKAQQLAIGTIVASNKLHIFQSWLEKNRKSHYLQSEFVNLLCLIATEQKPSDALILNFLGLGALSVMALGGLLMLISGGSPYTPSVLGVLTFFAGVLILMFSYIIPLVFWSIVFVVDTQFFEAGLLGVQKGYSPIGIIMVGFTGFQIKLLLDSFYIGFADIALITTNE